MEISCSLYTTLYLSEAFVRSSQNHISNYCALSLDCPQPHRSEQRWREKRLQPVRSRRSLTTAMSVTSTWPAVIYHTCTISIYPPTSCIRKLTCITLVLYSYVYVNIPTSVGYPRGICAHQNPLSGVWWFVAWVVSGAGNREIPCPVSPPN